MKLNWPLNIEKKYNCIHLHSQAETRFYKALTVGVKGAELRIIETAKANTIEELAGQIDKKLPAVVCISGAKIIDKILGCLYANV